MGQPAEDGSRGPLADRQKGASQRRPDSAGQGAGGDPLQRHQVPLIPPTSKERPPRRAPRKRKSSIFDVISLPANLDELAEEEDADAARNVAAGKDPEAAFAAGRQIIFTAYIPKMHRPGSAVTGTQIRRMFCDQPAMLRSFMRKGCDLVPSPLPHASYVC